MSDTNFDIDFDLGEVEADIRPISTKQTFLHEWWRSIDRINLGLFLALLSIGVIL